MFSFRMLLCALTLTLLAVAVESSEVFFGPVIRNRGIENSMVQNSVVQNKVVQNPVVQNPVQNPVVHNPVVHNPVVHNPMVEYTDPYYYYAYESPVVRAEKVIRPMRSLQSAYGPISHSGVKVTLEDGSQWLIHKGDTGTDTQMVVTSAENMSFKWKSVEAKEINGRKTVGDFVKAGGDTYDINGANCHHATDAMMNL